MNKHFLSLFLISILFLSMHESRSVAATNEEYNELNIEILADTTISLSFQNDIESLSLNAFITQTAEDSFVRVLIRDNNGDEFQVFEANRIFYEKNSFEIIDFAEETELLNHFRPSELVICITNATIFIHRINYKSASRNRLDNDIYKNEWKSIKRMHVSNIVDRINEYNTRNGKLWRAAVTEISLLPFKEKKRVMGLNANSNTYGLEYYCGGIFEIGEASEGLNRENLNSPYVPSFSWCDKHGKNWITSIKHQGESGYCWAFTDVALVEAMTNLYYNQTLNLDLSEQDVGWYTYANEPHNGYYGGRIKEGLDYIKANGVIDETTLPFQDTPYPNMPTTRPSGYECVSFNQYFYKYNGIIANNPDTLKNLILHQGPLASAVVLSDIQHAMLLVGYGVIADGDTINYDENNVFAGTVVSSADSLTSEYIGRTYWKFKNSYGINAAPGHNGYMYFMFNNYMKLESPYGLVPIITTLNYDSSDIICEDADGDGYYCWGLGTRPTSCPSWAPLVQDGDDSDFTKGPMNMYGHLEDLTLRLQDTIYIEHDTIWNSHSFIYNPVVIRNNAKLTLCDTTHVYTNAEWRVENGSKIIINGGVLKNSFITFATGSEMEIINNGKIEVAEEKRFKISMGSKMKMHYGKIN